MWATPRENNLQARQTDELPLAEFQHVILTIDDLYMVGAALLHHITGLEISLLIEQVFGGLRAIEVTGDHQVTFNAQFAPRVWLVSVEIL